MSKNTDSYCGLYCGACGIHRAYKTGKKSSFSKFWDVDTIKLFQDSQRLPYTESDLELKCKGCKSDTVFVNCRSCEIKNCAIEREIEHCSSCDDYPCNIHKKQREGERILPHLKDRSRNLESIKVNGVETWLEGEKNRWSCSACGTEFSWYERVCSSCGEKFKNRSYKFGWLNGKLFKIGMKSSSKQK
ncbi:DUF3795 domain-containing protein [Anaeromicrobium sediminis]|nr:DUF3795 domain-containing protein [Anaeromicrobium sediminis]